MNFPIEKNNNNVANDILNTNNENIDLKNDELIKQENTNYINLDNNVDLDSKNLDNNITLDLNNDIKLDLNNNFENVKINEIKLLPIQPIQENTFHSIEVTEDLHLPDFLNLGVYTLSYCGGCKVLKNNLLEKNIPFVEYQLDSENGPDQFIYENLEKNKIKYGFADTVPQLIHVYDFSIGDIKPNFESENYIQISKMIKEFSDCTKTGRLNVCLDKFLEEYAPFNNSFIDFLANNVETIDNEVNLDIKIDNLVNTI